MGFPNSICDKVTPFIINFKTDLANKIQAIDMELAAKGLIGSGQQIIRQEEAFNELFFGLLNQTKEIILRGNYKYQPSNFNTIRTDTQELRIL